MRIHRVTIPALALAACVAGTPARAAGSAATDSASPQADVGALTGLAIGAAAAGPVGAVLGAAAGIALGDHYHRQKQSLAQANESLARSQAHGARLEQTLDSLDEVGMNVSFRTDDASIKAEDMPPLLKLGALAAAMPRVTVRVAGFADPRGSHAYNQALSLRRAQAVAAALGNAGVPVSRLIVEARGSSGSSSADGDLDAYALDRRVTVRLERAPPAPLASQGTADVLDVAARRALP
ncbi:MAG TPA: OmpA family protein [Steroidobacteraceae bacterium]|nr:OmpA family protein [Steroidobacteraceae bacterium]